MSHSTYELIGEIIHPRPRAQPGPHPALSSQPRIPLSALIGWILGPPGRGLAQPAAAQAGASPTAAPRPGTAPAAPARPGPLPLPPV